MQRSTQHLLEDPGTFIGPDGELRTAPPDGYADTHEAWAEDATEFRMAFTALTQPQRHAITVRALKQAMAADVIDQVHDALIRLRDWDEEHRHSWVDYRVNDAIRGLQAAHANLRLLHRDQHSPQWRTAIAAIRAQMFPQHPEG